MVAIHTQDYLAHLASLSNEELDHKALALVQTEKKNQAELIAHIALIGERRWHIDLGYSSLFAYCTDRLKLDEGSVYLRLQVAKIIRQFPDLLSLLATGRFHLSALAKLGPILSQENYADVIREAEGKSKRDVEELVVRWHPSEAFKPSIVKKRSPSLDMGENREEHATVAKTTIVETIQPHRNKMTAIAPGDGLTKKQGDIKAASEDRYNFRFSADSQFRDNLERLAEVMGINDVTGNLEKILAQAVDLALEKKDPKRIAERQRKRVLQGAKKTMVTREIAGDVQASSHGDTDQGEKKIRRRYIPLRLARVVRQRAGYQCQYVGPDGRRCQDKTSLEIDHIVAFAKGGEHTLHNLQLLCRTHNQRKAEKDFGNIFMARRRHTFVRTKEEYKSP